MRETPLKIREDYKDLELISAHMPKTGGSTLRIWLQKIYGKENLYRDKNDGVMEPASEMNIDPEGYLESFVSGYPFLRNKRVVHGHFWINKYQYITGVPRITFLRHPVDRLISAYWNMKIFAEGQKKNSKKIFGPLDKLVTRYRVWNRKRRVRHETILAYFMNKNLGIVEYARLPVVRNIYTGVFLRDVDMAIFDLIGDFSRMKDEMTRLKALLGVDIDFDPPRANITDFKASGYKEFKEGIKNDKATMARLNGLLSKDIAFYEKYAGR